jgi:DNA primase catalytic core
MPRIPDEEIDRIKREADLLALARARGLVPKKHGSKDWVVRCPFHGDSEESPNLILSPAKGLYHCMACGAAGNAIQFVGKFDGISFRHAFELLAEGGSAAFDTAKTRLRTKSTAPKLPCPLDGKADDPTLLGQVTGYYHERLIQSKAALDYLASRGLDDDALVKRFRIGFADRTLGLRLPDRGGREGAALRERLQTLGVFRKESGHEHFNGSIVFPIFNATGQVSEMYGRKITKALRKGTPDHLYLPGPHAGIFNPDALKHPEIILCESIIDALTFVRHGMENATCIYGTQGFTGELFEAIKAANPDAVRLAYDADDSGEKAAKRDAEKLKAIGIECYRIRLPMGEDVNAFALAEGGEALKKAVRCAEWLGHGSGSPKLLPEEEAASSMDGVERSQWLGHSSGTPAAAPQKSGIRPVTNNDTAPIADPAPASSSLVAELAAETGGSGAPPDAAKKESGSVPSHPELAVNGEHYELRIEGRSYRVGGLLKNGGLESLKITLRLWCGERFHLDQIDLCRDNDRRRFCEHAAHECRLEPDLIRRDLGKLLLACERAQDTRLAAELEPGQPAAMAMDLDARKEAEELLGSPNLIERIGRDFETCGMVGEKNNRLVGYLACTSRLLPRPLAVIIQSTSAAGKSTLMDAILAMFPEEERIKYSAMTGQSLYYLGESNLKHKVLAIVEEEGAERASYALKLLQSEGELTIASTGKNPKTGQMETQTYHVEGPVMIFLTTTAIDIDEELQNRCLTLSVDESTEQTKRIHEVQRSARTLAGIERGEARDGILRAHRNAQRLLESFPVWNPFVEQLTFTSERTRTRRDHEKYLTLIDAVTLLHQKQRQRVTLPSGRQALAATLDDIKTANRLAPEVLGRSLDELPPQTRKLWNVIKAIVTEAGEDWKRFTFTRRALRDRAGWSVTQVRVHLERLHELEYVMPRQGRNGLRFEYGILIDPKAADSLAHIGLIDPEKLKNARAAPRLRPEPDGKNSHPAAPDKKAKSGSSPRTPKESPQPDGLSGTHIRDTGKTAIVS